MADRARALRLLAADPLPAVPLASDVVPAARRPGELHETVSLDQSDAAWLACEARSLGVEPDVLGAALLECAVVALEIGRQRFGRTRPRELPARRAASAADADYVRAVTLGRARSGQVRPPASIGVPVRVYRRMSGSVSSLLRHTPPATAIAWEIAAVTAGHTITEWALLSALHED